MRLLKVIASCKLTFWKYRKSWKIDLFCEVFCNDLKFKSCKFQLSSKTVCWQIKLQNTQSNYQILKKFSHFHPLIFRLFTYTIFSFVYLEKDIWIILFKYLIGRNNSIYQLFYYFTKTPFIELFHFFITIPK